MNAGTLLLVVKDLTAIFVNKGILRTDGSFDQQKLDTIQEDLDLAASIEALLKFYGVAVPDKVDRIIQMVPLIVGLVQQ